MKMHSYAFYNGHLSETRRRLNDLDNPDKASKAAAYRYPSSRTHLHEIPQSPSNDEPSETTLAEVRQLREDLAFELASPLGHVSYPQNLTMKNWADFIFCPTLCYELEYPRTAAIRWDELFYKTLAVFGCIFLMTVCTEHFVLPILNESSVRLQNSTSASDFGLILGETIGRLLFPFMVIFLLVFLVIFEYLLGAFAEITRTRAPILITMFVILTFVQASPTANSTPTGGTAATGSSSPANGTSPCTTSSAATSTLPRAATCLDHSPPS
jgi:sterol O-acyltransferase